MKFEMWSVWHILYILSPIAIILLLWLTLRKRSQKTKYIVGVVIGAISLLILVVRNIDILIHYGFDPEAIPLQVCHFGNIMVFIALVFKSKIATSILWCLNMFSAFASLVFADSLLGYASLWAIRPQAYIWGHLFIVVGALYAVIMKIVRIDFKSFLYGNLVLVGLVGLAIVLNPYFNNHLHYSINYFYLFTSDGIPLEFLYNLKFTFRYGSWFEINYIYTFSVIAIFLVLMYGIYNLQKLFYIKDKDYKTHHIFIKKQRQSNKA